MVWVVNVKGSLKEHSWEICVVKEDNKHGIRSWGWYDKNKILISGQGSPCRAVIPEYVFKKNLELAQHVCNQLNCGETYESVMGDI